MGAISTGPLNSLANIPKQQFLAGQRSGSQGTCSNVWKHSGFSGLQGAVGIRLVETRDDVKCMVIHTRVPILKNHLPPNVTGAGAEQPGTKSCPS